ncbi:hypothetical protein [Neisseria sp.]|uniref:hypothetical protein n=1 Tax=Neisseria sp. TaxID=192066 RepID=UPI0026DB5EEF|nr:hypothetical protein [Neisseria sp.]MDO4907353.1 hypothetical protein [Neisseria sp.]
MELYFKTALVFAHFILAGIVLAKVLHTDFLLLKNYTVPLGKPVIEQIGKTKKTAVWGLAGLIATGIALVVYGILTMPGYFDNPKLWVKFICVAVLTLNGFLVHRLDRHVKENTVLADFPYRLSVQVSIVGALSSANWIFACWLGIARAWNKNMPFEEVLGHYGLVLAAALCISMAVNIRFTQIQNL